MDDFSPSLFPLPPFQITDEQFNAFHLSDRMLYQILVHDLERDPSESVNVMGFWMWLEKKVCVKVNLIQILLDLPHNLVNEVADESVVCLLSCLNENMPILESVYELAVLPNLAHPNILSQKLSLQDFRHNRTQVINSVNKIVVDVCIRAFKDLVMTKKPLTPSGFINPGQTNIVSENGKALATSSHVTGFVFPYPGQTNIFSTDNNGKNVETSFSGFPVYQRGTLFGGMTTQNTNQAFPGFSVAGKSLPVSNNMLGRLCVINEEDYDNILPDDRTIFITFSKGYSVSEDEVRQFFTRKFGNFIEAIYMQDVLPHQQALYARIVSRSATAVDIIVQGGRAKYNIYGKHVWARKYVKKNKKSIAQEIEYEQN